jgi:hypothetical protein
VTWKISLRLSAADANTSQAQTTPGLDHPTAEPEKVG